MFALGIRYLNGWAMATHPANRDQAEWPPHPDRVFMALAAAHFETGEDPTERQALEWLQTLPPPALSVDEAAPRTIVTSFVPVNDTEISRGKKDTPAALAKRMQRIDAVATLRSAKEAGLAMLPEYRSRQARSFPVAVPLPNVSGKLVAIPSAYLLWEEDIPPQHQPGLAALCAKVVSVGHSASLVQMWIELAPPKANLIPVQGVACQHRLRITSQGRLQQLQDDFSARLRPRSAPWHGYGNVSVPTQESLRPQSCFDPNLLVLCRVAGPKLGLESALQLTGVLRDTVMSQCPIEPPPEWLGGHTADGSPSRQPHLACLPLANVGHEHAEGHLLGLALAIPRDVPADEQQRCLGTKLYDPTTGLPCELELRMGATGVWKVTLVDAVDSRTALQNETWTAARNGAKRWVTVTPMVFDRHPKKPGDAEETVALACEHIGLPRPTDVILSPVSMFVGVPHARRYPLMQRKTGGNLHHTHLILTFDQPVVGPILLGAGRYRGYGLCRPWLDGGVA